MGDLGWLERLGQLALVARQCERRIVQHDAEGAARAFADFEAACDRFERMARTARPACHEALAADLCAVRRGLAARIRELRAASRG